MGLIQRLGSETSSSTLDSKTELNIRESTRDISITRTSLSPNRYPLVYEGLLKFISGNKIKVDYYRNNINYLSKQTHSYNFSLERSDVELSFDLIKNMEIVLKSGLDIGYNDETGEMEVNGEATIYPRLDPNIGDIFIFKLPDNLLGVFIVNDLKRLSISSGTAYDISFHLYSYMNDEIAKKLNDNVVETYYFDKDKFLGNDIALLKRSDYNLLMTLRNIKVKLYNRWIQQYYDHDFRSITNTKTYTYTDSNTGDTTVEKITYYDPYVIEFLTNILNLSSIIQGNTIKVLNQYMSNIVDEYFNDTIWNALIKKDPFSITKKYGVLAINPFRSFDSAITRVAHQHCLYLHESNTVDDILKTYPRLKIYGYNHESRGVFNYILSENFFTVTSKIDITDMNDTNIDFNTLSEVEKIIAKYLYTIDIFSIKNDIITFLDQYDIMNSQDLFYDIPIYLFFVNIAIGVLK